METPEDLKVLYSHWDKHAQGYSISNSTNSNIDLEVMAEIIAFVNERMSIFEKKQSGTQQPFTHDPILRDYRFCNIFREFDRQTIFFHQLLSPVKKDFPLWLLNMLFCRSVCRIETINAVGLLSYEQEHNKQVREKLCALPSPKYGNAYIFPISLIQKSAWKTREDFFCIYYPQIMQRVAAEIEPFDNLSVTTALATLLPVFGFNLKFLFTELLIDVAYQYPEKIDLFQEFPIGPGSIPTMKKLSPTQDPTTTNLSLVGCFNDQINLPTYNGNPIPLSAENWEGIGCEFRKYSNLKSGTGRKRLYKTSLPSV